jgi:hypothetical protein
MNMRYGHTYFNPYLTITMPLPVVSEDNVLASNRPAYNFLPWILNNSIRVAFCGRFIGVEFFVQTAMTG